MTLKFNPYKNINPQIYAYTTPHVTTNNGWIKIGYNEKQTVEKIPVRDLVLWTENPRDPISSRSKNETVIRHALVDAFRA